MAKTIYVVPFVISLCMCLVCYDARAQTHVCKELDPCRCQFENDGSVVDLTSLGNTDGTPRFKDILSEDGLLYSYNPCHPFDDDNCKNAAVCKHDKASGKDDVIGYQDAAQFTYDEMTAETVIGYAAGALAEIHSFVYWICDNSANPGPAQIFANGTMANNLYVLTIYTACACGGRCDDNGLISTSSSVQLSIGTYICFGLVGVVMLYFILGTLIMKFARKAQGRQIIPHSDFWCRLPANVKNGCRFTLSKCGASTAYSDV